MFNDVKSKIDIETGNILDTDEKIKDIKKYLQQCKEQYQALQIEINKIKNKHKNEQISKIKKQQEEEAYKENKLREKQRQLLEGDDNYDEWNKEENGNIINFNPKDLQTQNNDVFSYKRRIKERILNNKPATMQQQTNNLLQDQAMKQITINAENNNNINNVDVGNQQSNSQQLQQEKEKAIGKKPEYTEEEIIKIIICIILIFMIWWSIIKMIDKHEEKKEYEEREKAFEERLKQQQQNSRDNSLDETMASSNDGDDIGNNGLSNINNQSGDKQMYGINEAFNRPGAQQTVWF